jgi:DNA-binding NtrC family response regulator
MPEHGYGDGSVDPTTELEWGAAKGPWRIEIGQAHASELVTLSVGQRLVLGSGASASIRVADRAVSSRHCTIEATDLGIRVEDLDSKNGVFVGPARVKTALLSGDGSLFVIGRTAVAVCSAHERDEPPQHAAIPGMLGRSAPMRRVAAEIRRHAGLRAPVLIHGESGTGKDLAARALHTLGGRSGPYVPLNVGAIAESLADSELFGHRRGAFTGALSTRSGAFEQAHLGTLFLDEIAELPHAIQVKLLRVVEDGMVRPVGATQAIRVDVRIVSATWAQLDRSREDGSFRQDLYHRLATVVIRLPPLRERRSDIPLLAAGLLERLRSEVGSKQLTPGALAQLVAHTWPGNVRELASVLYRAAVSSDAERIEAHHLDIAVPGRPAQAARALSPAEAAGLLERHQGNVSAAARAARVARSTFRAWLDKAGAGSAAALRRSR